MIEFQNVSKRYASGQEALKHVSFQMAQGGMAFLTGHSGAGKSTLLKLVAMLESVSNGQIILGDMPLSELDVSKVPYLRRAMGFVFQNPQLLNDRTVFDNVAMPLIIAGFRPQEIPRRVRAALDKVNLLHYENAFPAHLSCGEQQRIGIARAVVHKPKILLADEPTGNLDPELAADTMQLLMQFNQVGVTVLVASHNTSLLARLPFRMLTLKQGQLL